MKASADKMRAVAALLGEWGVRVVYEPGWETRGYRGRSMRVREMRYGVWGSMCHHTGTVAPGPYPSGRVLIHGHARLPGPLCNFGLERGPDPAVRLVAAGLANHAGKGSYPGISSGNYQLWGIEAEHSGSLDEPWESYDTYVLLCRAIRLVVGDGCVLIGHKEWAPGRKPDPRGIDMDAFRADVARTDTPAGEEEGDEMLKEAAGEIDELYFAKRGEYPSPGERQYWVNQCAVKIYDENREPKSVLVELRRQLKAEQ